MIRIVALTVFCLSGLSAFWASNHRLNLTASPSIEADFELSAPSIASAPYYLASPNPLMARTTNSAVSPRQQTQSFFRQDLQLAQDLQGRGFQGRGMGGGSRSRRSDYPMWTANPFFEKDIFTFIRIQFDSYGGRGAGQGWGNDYPDCDWNFSVRLTQLTSFKVHPEGDILRLTDDRLFDYPFAFMTNMGGLQLSNAEQKALRKFLLNGGFLMADDFWAAASWQQIRQQMKLVLPDLEPVELSLDHPIFHIVYNFASLPQVPSIRAWQRGLGYEDWHGPFERGDTSPHFWGYHDNNGRLMALFCQNNDIADGWEREGEEVEYFRNYSVKWSYPLGINILTYAMTQ
ncbi:MAG: DUF4159 domain-containing protein [Pirellulales bacterium]